MYLYASMSFESKHFLVFTFFLLNTVLGLTNDYMVLYNSPIVKLQHANHEAQMSIGGQVMTRGVLSGPTGGFCPMFAEPFHVTY